jgi:xylulokinase
MNYLIALDIGTTSVKAGIFNSDGVSLAIALEEYQLITPTTDQAELDPLTYWTASCKTIRSVLDRANIDSGSVSALTVSSQGETLISLDNNGNPVRNAIVWMDNRAASEAKRLKSFLGHNVYEVTGIPEVTPTWTACKILWLKENEPDHFRATAKFLLVQDYIIYQLTGKYITDGSISCTTLLFDIIKHAWWQKALESVGIGIETLPEVQKAGSIAGPLTTQVSQILGLPTSVSVVCGGMDQSVGAIGAGNIEEGVVSETSGAALAIQISIHNPLIDPRRTIPVYVHSVNGLFLFVPVCPTAGMAFKWFKDNFIIPIQPELINNMQVDYYEEMNNMAAQVAAGCEGLVMLPHLMGAFSPESNPFARGTYVGFTLHHKKAHFVRAIMEAVAFMLRQNIETVQQAGVNVEEIRTSGGVSRSHIWNQIKADVCGLPIVNLENSNSALVGDAILGGAAVGIFSSIQEGCKIMVHTSTHVEPTKTAKEYNQYYQRYLDLDRTLNGFFKRNFSS